MNTARLHKFLSVAVAAIVTAIAAPCFATTAFPSGHFARGKMSLYFDGSGKFSVREGNDNLMVEGRYESSSDQITFTDQSGKEACTGQGQESGTYRWTYARDELAFVKIEDHCDARAHDLTAGTWQRKK